MKIQVKKIWNKKRGNKIKVHNVRTKIQKKKGEARKKKKKKKRQ